MAESFESMEKKALTAVEQAGMSNPTEKEQSTIGQHTKNILQSTIAVATASAELQAKVAAKELTPEDSSSQIAAMIEKQVAPYAEIKDKKELAMHIQGARQAIEDINKRAEALNT
ncbi:MAG: hypothetical protein K2Y22_14565 [Candidatus Obscuribacterales bacterium]|nr:hypothetical protein [Candidatus Obscuribacterales bacterium]